MTSNSYSVRYAFNGYLQGSHAAAIDRIAAGIAALQREGVDIELRGATQTVNAAGQLVAVTARFAAPDKGAIGRLNCRAMLPACGQPRRLEEATTGAATRRPAIASR